MCLELRLTDGRAEETRDGDGGEKLRYSEIGTRN